MKVKLGRIKAIEASLGKLVNTDVDIAIAYKLSKLLKIIVAETEVLEENRTKLIKKYSSGKPDKDGNIKVDPDKQQDFFKDVQVLFNEEAEIDFTPIPIDSFSDIKLTTLDVLNLEGIVFQAEEKEAEEVVEPDIVEVAK
jgi:hypothetical protein